MCLRKIWPQRFLDSPHHLLDGFWGPQDGFFGFSSGGYQERGDLDQKDQECCLIEFFHILTLIIEVVMMNLKCL